MKNHNTHWYKWNTLNCESPSQRSIQKDSRLLPSKHAQKCESSSNLSKVRLLEPLLFSVLLLATRHCQDCKTSFDVHSPNQWKHAHPNEEAASLCNCHFLWHCWYAGSCWCLQDIFQKLQIWTFSRSRCLIPKNLELGTLNVRPSLETETIPRV